MSEQNIKSILLEERSFAPSPAFAARARIKPADLASLRERAREDHVGFWSELAAQELTWEVPFTRALDDSRAPNYRWFTDGQLNASVNCLDVHLEERGHKTRDHLRGRAGRHAPPELPANCTPRCAASPTRSRRRASGAAIASSSTCRWCRKSSWRCTPATRIGAIHSVVFGGFSAVALKDRIEDTEARLVVTADGGWRGGQRHRAQGRHRQGARRAAARASSVSSCLSAPASPCR